MPKTKPPTLADELYQITQAKHAPKWWRNRDMLQRLLFQAHRFVLDDGMAAFLADLSLAAYLSKRSAFVGDSFGRAFKTHSKHHRKLTEQLRLGARLPHKVTWIEYNLKATLRRGALLKDTQGEQILAELEGVPDKEGWLIQDMDGGLAIASVFNSSQTVQEDGFDHWVFPWSYIWSYGDSMATELWRRPIAGVQDPRHRDAMQNCQIYSLGQIFAERRRRGKPSLFSFGGVDEPHLSEVATGLIGYRSDAVDITMCPFGCYHESGSGTDWITETLHLLVEWSGVLRRMWAFLATVNDIPVLSREVKASKGFIARGSYKRFLDHHTITLHVPIKKDLRLLARHVVAAARRRLHKVRGHWRKDWRHMPALLCQHEWTVVDESTHACKHCHGHRVFVHEHERGDASLGVLMTDYEVEHST